MEKMKGSDATFYAVAGNIYDKHFECFVESFNLLLNERNKNKEAFVYVLFKNQKYDLVKRLLHKCVKNHYRLEFNLEANRDENELKNSLNFIDLLISNSNSIKSMIDKNLKDKNYVLFNYKSNYNNKNINVNNSENKITDENIKEKLKSLEEQIEAKRNRLHKIHEMLDFIYENAEILVKTQNDPFENSEIKSEKNKIYFYLYITNKLKELEDLFQYTKLSRKNSESQELEKITDFIRREINNKNFEYYRGILFNIIRSFIFYSRVEEVLSLLNYFKLNFSKDFLFRFIFDLKNLETEENPQVLNTYNNSDNTSNKVSYYYNRFKPNGKLSFQGNGNLLCSENLYDLMILNNNSNILKNIKEEKNKLILEFILDLVREDPIYINIFSEIYCNKYKNKTFLQSLGLSNSISLSTKLDLLARMNSLVNDKKDLLSSLEGKPLSLNFYQISFLNLKYLLRQIDLDTELGLEAFNSLLKSLNLTEIKNQVEKDYKYINPLDPIEKMLESFSEIDLQKSNIKHKKSIFIHNNFKPEFSIWIKMQNNNKKIENILDSLLTLNLLDFEPFYIKRTNIYYKLKREISYNKLNLLETINLLCKRNKISLEQDIIKRILNCIINKAEEYTLNVTMEKKDKFNFFHRNILLCDLIEFLNLQVLKNKEIITYINENNTELSMLIAKAVRFLSESIEISTKIKKDLEFSNIFQKQIFLSCSVEENFITFKKNAIQNLESFSSNFTKVIFGSLEKLVKSQHPELQNSYFYYDKESSNCKVYNRKLFSQSFISQNRLSDSKEILKIFKNLVSNKIENKVRLEAIWSTDFNSLNYFQKFNILKIQKNISGFKKNNGNEEENEFFLLNLFYLYEKSLINIDLRNEIRILFKSFLFNLMKKESFFKSISYLLNKLNIEKFPNTYDIFLFSLEEALKENFEQISENHISQNYGPSSIYYCGSSDKNYFFEFIYFIFRDFILTDFNTDNSNYAARFRILNLLAQFLKKIRNQEFYEYFNIAIYYVFKLNFLKQKINIDYKFKKLIDEDVFVIKNIPMIRDIKFEYQTQRKDVLTDVAFNYQSTIGKEKVHFEFKKLFKDNSIKTKTKIKSLCLILLYKLCAIKDKDNLKFFVSIYKEIRSKIIVSENVLSLDLKNKFDSFNKFNNEKENKAKNNSSDGVNSSLFISEILMEEIINNNCNQPTVNNEHAFIQDFIFLVEAYDTLFNLLSEYFCYLDSEFFRDYFKKVFYRLNLIKLEDNYNNCVINHFKFFIFQINEFCQRILPNYIKIKKDLAIKIERLPLDMRFNEFFTNPLKSIFSESIKSNFKNIESKFDLEKANNPEAKKGEAQAKQKTVKLENYKLYNRFSSQKFYLELTNSEAESDLLLNGICPDAFKLPSFLAIKVSEENKKLNKLVKEFNAKINFKNYVFAPIINLNLNKEFEKKVRLRLELNALIKNTFDFSSTNFYELQSGLFELNLKKFNLSLDSNENIFLKIKVNESLGHNLLLNIIKDNYVYKDNFSIKNYLGYNKSLNKNTFLSFMDFNEQISVKYYKKAFTFNLPCNPFSMILQKDSSPFLLKFYAETLFKLDQFASDSLNYSNNNSSQLNCFLANFYPADFISKMSYQKPIESIKLFINSRNFIGFSKNIISSKELENNCFVFERSMSIITENFRKNTAAEIINWNGSILEALYYMIETFLINNKDLESILKFSAHSHKGKKEYMYLKCSKKSIGNNNLNTPFAEIKKQNTNIQQILDCHSKILTDFLYFFNFKESQNKLTMSILNLIIKKAFHLINLQVRQEPEVVLNSDVAHNQNKNSSRVKAFYTELLNKTINQILPLDSNTTVNKKDTVILQSYWENLFNLLELNIKILDSSDTYCYLYYSYLAKVILTEDSDFNHNLKQFKKQLFSKPHKFILLAMSIFFNDSLVFKKLLSWTNAGILYEQINLDVSILSKFIYQSKAKNTIAHNLYYCSSNNLNAFYLLFLNLDKKEFSSIDYDGQKQINFETVFTSENNVLKSLALDNPLRDILCNKAFIKNNNNSFIENYIQKSQKILNQYSYENEVEEYFDIVFWDYEYLDGGYISREEKFIL